MNLSIFIWGNFFVRCGTVRKYFLFHFEHFLNLIPKSFFYELWELLAVQKKKKYKSNPKKHNDNDTFNRIDTFKPLLVSNNSGQTGSNSEGRVGQNSRSGWLLFVLIETGFNDLLNIHARGKNSY